MVPSPRSRSNSPHNYVKPSHSSAAPHDPRYRNVELARIQYLQQLAAAQPIIRAGSQLGHTIAPPERVLRPRVDMYEDVENGKTVAYIELPGLAREEIDVRLTPRHALVISGERRAPPLAQSCLRPVETVAKDSDGGAGSDVAVDKKVPEPVRPAVSRNLHPISEIKFGRFYRVIEVPSRTRAIDITANMKDGMLQLSWPSSSRSDEDDTPIPIGLE